MSKKKVSLGNIVPEGPGSPERGEAKSRIIYPTLVVDAKKFPKLSAAKIGETCEIEITVRKVSHGEKEQYELRPGEKGAQVVRLEMVSAAEDEDMGTGY